MLRIQHLSKTFNPGTINENRVFTDLSLEVEEGDFISIIGSNGAGKSTLLNMISGTIEADRGSILLDGNEVVNKAEYIRCKDIGRVFQDPFKGVAPNMTILENIALADNKGKRYGFSLGINKKRVDYYKEMVSQLDLGLEDKLYNKVSLLSGGQRQALTLLMAVMSKPKILLLDEHTAALDPKTSEKIMEITRNIVADSKVTTLMVTHNLKYALNSGNRLFMMHRGNILFDVRDEEKEALDVNSLLGMFEKASQNGEEAISDRTLFG